MCTDGIERINTAKEVLKEQLDSAEFDEIDREPLEYVIGLLEDI